MLNSDKTANYARVRMISNVIREKFITTINKSNYSKSLVMQISIKANSYFARARARVRVLISYCPRPCYSYCLLRIACC